MAALLTQVTIKGLLVPQPQPQNLAMTTTNIKYFTYLPPSNKATGKPNKNKIPQNHQEVIIHLTDVFFRIKE